MSINSTTKKVDSVTVIGLSGKITIGEECKHLRETIRGQLSEGTKSILLNLGDISYIDSTGIGELVSFFTSVSRQGGQLKLLNLTKKVHDLLQITKLVTVFDIFEDEAKAVKSFGSTQA